MNEGRKKILFVGAGGELASIVVPELAKKYDVVGIAGKRHELKEHCIDFYNGNLLQDYNELFQKAFQAHRFDAVIWNPVKYFFTPLLKTTRETLHTEFDLAIALPLECVKTFLNSAHMEHKPVFVLVSSMSAFGHSSNLASYGVIKNAQVKLAEMLSIEISDRLSCKVIAPGNMKRIDHGALVEAFHNAIEDSDKNPLIYKVPQA